MSDKFVLVATFSMPVEAQLARGRLEAEGIRVFLSGGETVNVFSGIQGVSGKMTLHVAEADAERAATVLAEGEAEEDDAGPPEEARLWLCPLCGDAVNDDLSVCPACETPRPPPRKSSAVKAASKRDRSSQQIQEDQSPESEQVTADTPIEAVPSAVEDDLDIPDLETFIGDDLVRRAFLTALFGSVFPPLTIYSLWLLGRLAVYPGKLSPRVMPRLYLGLALDVLVFVCYLVFFGRLFYR